MARGLPSMTALLGMLALAGYQNRDKIADMLKGVTAGAPQQSGQGGVGDLLKGLGSNIRPNKPVQPHDVRRAIGPDVLSELAQRTGLSEEEIVARLSKTLPDAVDQYTPDGKLPVG